MGTSFGLTFGYTQWRTQLHPAADSTRGVAVRQPRASCQVPRRRQRGTAGCVGCRDASSALRQLPHRGNPSGPGPQM